MVLILALWGTATIFAQRRLDHLIASYRAAGEPVFAEDLEVFKGIPDDENAATYYGQAEEAYIWPASFPIDLSVHDLIRAADSQEPGKYAAEIERFINTNALTIELLKKGANCDRVAWQDTFTNPLAPTGMGDPLAARRLGQLLSTAMGAFHSKRRDCDMLDLLYAQVRIAKQRTSMSGSLLDHLVTTSISGLGCVWVENIGSKMLVGGWVDDGLHCRNRMRQIILELSNEVAFRDSFHAALIGERVIFLDIYQALRDGKPMNPIFSTAPRSYALMIRPIIVSHCRRILQYVDQVIEVSRCTQYPRVSSELNKKTGPRDWVGLSGFLADFITSPSYNATMTVEYTRIAKRRMAALALAIRMFELDHGHRPETLEELVPSYFGVIPSDPFAEGGNPVQFNPRAASPVLYCVGPDGVDDGGRYGPRESDNASHSGFDLLFFLDGDRPRSNP